MPMSDDRPDVLLNGFARTGDLLGGATPITAAASSRIF